MLMLSSSTVAAKNYLFRPVLWILSGTYKAMMALVDMELVGIILNILQILFSGNIIG